MCKNQSQNAKYKHARHDVYDSFPAAWLTYSRPRSYQHSYERRRMRMQCWRQLHTHVRTCLPTYLPINLITHFQVAVIPNNDLPRNSIKPQTNPFIPEFISTPPNLHVLFANVIARTLNHQPTTCLAHQLAKNLRAAIHIDNRLAFACFPLALLRRRLNQIDCSRMRPVTHLRLAHVNIHAPSQLYCLHFHKFT